MYRFNFYLSDDQLSYLRELSDHTRLSVADHLRRMVDAYACLHGMSMSGAVVFGVQGHTSSGAVWIGKGY